jgi:acylphosphatase
MLVARRLVVSGRVQGVGFRFFAVAQAELEGVGGWARNLADGRVEILIEGDLEAVDRMERRIRRGPPAARVDVVDVEIVRPSGRLAGFRVRPSTPLGAP